MELGRGLGRGDVSRARGRREPERCAGGARTGVGVGGRAAGKELRGQQSLCEEGAGLGLSELGRRWRVWAGPGEERLPPCHSASVPTLWCPPTGPESGHQGECWRKEDAPLPSRPRLIGQRCPSFPQCVASCHRYHRRRHCRPPCLGLHSEGVLSSFSHCGLARQESFELSFISLYFVLGETVQRGEGELPEATQQVSGRWVSGGFSSLLLTEGGLPARSPLRPFGF